VLDGCQSGAQRYLSALPSLQQFAVALALRSDRHGKIICMSFIDVQRRLLTLDEVASTLGLSRRTVERRVKAGEIPALQLGGPRTAIRVPVDELDAWLESEPRDAA